MSAIFEAALDQWRAVRDDFELYRASVYDRAEAECRGNLLNADAKERGVSAWSLFIGPHARAHRWASEELTEWWSTNRRLTFAEFEAMHLDGHDMEHEGVAA